MAWAPCRRPGAGRSVHKRGGSSFPRRKLGLGTPYWIDWPTARGVRRPFEIQCLPLTYRRCLCILSTGDGEGFSLNGGEHSRGSEAQVRDIFVSHSEEDSDVVSEIVHGLEAAGYSTWCYQRDSVPGLAYLTQVREAIDGARAVLLVVSNRSLYSNQVNSEVVHGHETGKPFIPILVNVTHVELEHRRPDWALALGATTSIRIPPEGVSSILPRLKKGLRKSGVRPRGQDRPLSHEDEPVAHRPELAVGQGARSSEECPCCGADLQSNWNYCPQCGAALRAREEYRILCKGVYADGVANVRERILLERKRIELGLSWAEARSIERGCAPRNVLDYSRLVEGVSVDGVIDEAERAFLRKKAQQLGIDEWLAGQIEQAAMAIGTTHPPGGPAHQ